VNALAMTSVHTTGINWESIGVLIATIIGSFAAAASWVSSRIDRNRKVTERVIKSEAKDIIDAFTDRHLEDYVHKRRKRGH
jgi:uncharacterized membrane protein YccC